jgi:hypothetical protein
MTTEQKIQAIRDAIERAKNHQSKMDQTAWDVPALSSLKIRHLMNNLGAVSTNYLECGVHRGGLFCSTVRNNNLDTAFAVDSFASDAVTGEGIEDEFDKNSLNCIDGTETVMFAKVADTFTVMPSDLPTIDLYLYDAAHDYESQRKAMTHFLPAMADEFIVCVDDYDWEDVWRGTHDGLKDSGCEILFEEAFKGGDHDNMTFWNGFYVALLKKK